MSLTQREDLQSAFMASVIKPLRQQKADQLIAQHQDANDELLVITAPNHFIAAPIVADMGITHILATDPEMIDNQFTGKISGTPCFQEGKIVRLKQWLERQAIEHKRHFEHMSFYSDSINDAPLLDYVDTAIAVDPDDALRQLALDKQWEIISLRDDT